MYCSKVPPLMPSLFSQVLLAEADAALIERDGQISALQVR
jgi:hypothetical protein